MKKNCIVFIIAVALIAAWASIAVAKFPAKPIKLIVYTKPGGDGRWGAEVGEGIGEREGG
jgi:tripartite-type tricarboxylate transporter receptor subunit TctC